MVKMITVYYHNLWQTHFTVFELITIMRQQDCIEYAHLLNRRSSRKGHHTKEDIKLLQSRVISTHDNHYPIHAQHFFRTNEASDMHNNIIFMSSYSEKFQIKDDISIQLLNMVLDDPRKTMILPSKLDILIDSRYELSCNITVSDGLENGAGGTAKKVSLTSNSF